MASAKSRPMPPPAPVTSTTLPFEHQSPEARVAAFEQAQQAGPFQLADFAALAGLVAFVGEPHGFLAPGMQFGLVFMA